MDIRMGLVIASLLLSLGCLDRAEAGFASEVEIWTVRIFSLVARQSLKKYFNGGGAHIAHIFVTRI